MNNIGIILNQDNNQSYLGKFYNRNRLEFPVIRKIYEQIETNKNNENIVLKNQINNDEKNISNTTITPSANEEEYVNTNMAEIEKEILNKTDKETSKDINSLINPNTININNEIDNDDIIVLDNNYFVSKINKTELNIETSNKYNIKIKNDELDLSNTHNNINEVNNYIDKNEKNELPELPELQFKYKFNSRELIFLWLSSIVLIVSIEYNLYSFFKNY